MKILSVFFSFLLLLGCSNTKTETSTCQAPHYSGSINKAAAGCFDYYLLAQTWAPEFCATGNRSTLNACKNLKNTWNAGNLSVHGLWPNYKAVNNQATYPAYCQMSPGCDGVKACTIKFKKLTALTKQQLQGLIAINQSWLLNHEWKKHGTCSGLSQEAYFNQVILIANKLATPKIIKQAIGKSLSYTQLIQAYGGQAWVNLICSRSSSGKQQYLMAVRTYWNKQGQRIKNPGKVNRSCHADEPVFIRRVE